MHAVEVAFESVYVSRPEPTKLSQPVIELLKWLRLQPVKTALCVHRGLYETSFSQHSQVLRNGRLGHIKLAFDLPYRLFGRRQETQY